MSRARQSIDAERVVDWDLDRCRGGRDRAASVAAAGAAPAARRLGGRRPAYRGLGTFSHPETKAGRQRDSHECPLLSDSVLFLFSFFIGHWAWWWKANAEAESSEQDERRSPLDMWEEAQGLTASERKVPSDELGQEAA